MVGFSAFGTDASNQALGHVHQREVVCEDPWILFPGNIQGRHIREAGAKGCTLVTVESGEVSEVEHQTLDVMRWSLCEVDVSHCDSVDAIYQAVRDALQISLDDAEGRPAAVRLMLHGRCSVHSQLQAELDHWAQEYRALATGLGGAGLWLEKVVIRTRPARSLEDRPVQDDALGGLLQAIDAMEFDQASLDALVEEISPLRQKLPAEMVAGDDPYDPTDPEQLKTTLESIKALLVNRLLTSEPTR